MISIRRLALVTALAGFVGGSLVAPPVAHASDGGSRTKRARRAAEDDGAPAPARGKKVTAKTILRWKKAGLDDETIAAKASAAGYHLTSRDKAKLKRHHASKALLGALANPRKDESRREERRAPGEDRRSAAPVTVASAAPAARRPLDLTKKVRPEDIDFESVPPPAGIPKEYVRADRNAPAKKHLDHSLRPAAPFEESAPPPPTRETKVASTSGDRGRQRVVFAAKPD